MSIASFESSMTSGLPYVLAGINMFLLAVMACPLITKKTKELPQLQQYYKYKKIIVIAAVVLFLVIAAYAGSKM